MRIAVDCHVHIYPCYDERRALEQALQQLPSADYRVLCLTEAKDCSWFSSLQAKRIPGFSLKACAEKNSCELVHQSLGSLFIIAGRQINSLERLEFIAMGARECIPDGLSWKETISAIKSAGALPVINWAPGKWWGSRGALVKNILRETVSVSAVCDTSLRPCFWKRPRLMQEAEMRGIPVLAGSDPLPLDGEEKKIGSYGLIFEGEFDRDAPFASLRALLTRPSPRAATFGRRSGCAEFTRRMLGLRLAKSAAKKIPA